PRQGGVLRPAAYRVALPLDWPDPPTSWQPQRRAPRARRGARGAHPRWNRGRVSDRKSTRLNSSHGSISYAVFCLKKKKTAGVHRQPARSNVRLAETIDAASGEIDSLLAGGVRL